MPTSTAPVVLLCAALAPLASLASARADTVVTSFPDATSPYGLLSMAPWQAFGQTFTVPAGSDTVLSSIRTRADIAGAAGANVRVYLYALAGNQTVGAPLFRSDPIGDPGDPSGTYTELAFTGIGATVTPGGTYALLFSNLEGTVSSSMNSTAWAATPTGPAASPYLNGLVGVSFGGPGLAQLSGATLNAVPNQAQRDLIVELTFVPAPAAAGALALGAAAAAAHRRR